ncbi:aldo/keto reductase [Xylariaceae sp. FL0016]|nr:aldo/keto reductase [Xylariaceae sp. FL0016]
MATTAMSVANQVADGLKKKTPVRQDSGYVSPEDSPALTVQLNDGNEIPQIALGVYKAPNGQETEDAVIAALDAGYRHIDSAARYANEEACGRALKTWLKKTGVPRHEVFITTKLWDADHGYEATFNALCDSLEKFQLEYFDLYLLHSPSDDKEKRHQSWRALETAQRLGKVRSIGVSNFGASHLDDLLAQTTTVPAVNQIEVHPFCQRPELIEKCKQHGIVIEAYSPLARGNKLEDPRVGAIAEKNGKSPAQILINWSASRGNVVLPKSLTAHRIKSNLESLDFQLSNEDLAALDALEENYVTGSLHRSKD